MTRPRPRIGSELLLVGLILGCLVGTWLFVVSMHRRAERHRKPVAVRPAPAAAPVQAAAPSPPPPPAPRPKPAPPPVVLVEDPTRKVVARLGAEEAEQRLEAQAADRRAETLQRARHAALEESERWRRREQVVRGQVEALSERARNMEHEVDTLAMERDVLAHERDATKAALARASHRSSFAVLPNRAPNGTWRRPIVIECRNGTATLQPQGPTFSLLDLSGLLGARSSPIVLAVVRELVRIQGLSGPDGAAAVPYIFFVVRPDGIRPFYEARARLEPLGIAFGYELVDQDMEIDFPDLDHPDEWDGSAPLPAFPVAALEHSPSPSDSSGRTDSRDHNPDDFRWPTSPHGAAPGSDPGEESGRLGSGTRGSGGFGRPPAGPGRDPSGDGGFALERLPDDTLDARRLAGESTPGFGRGSRMLPPQPRRGSASTPGMLPPIAGPAGTSGMLPPLSGSSGFAGSSPGSPPRGSARDRGPVAWAEPGRDAEPGRRPAGAPEAPVSPHPDDVSNLDGFSLMGRQPGEGAPFRPHGLRPGEPGAPPEEGSVSPGSLPPGTASSGSASPGSGRQRVPTLGSAGAGGLPGMAGSSEGSGSAMGGDAAGRGGTGSASAQPGGEGTPGEDSLVPRPRGPLRIEVPMEIVVACGPSGLTIHPGGYQLTSRTLKAKDPILAKSLRTIVHQRQQVDPMIRPKPMIRFLVEPGGGETYREARRQTVLSGLDWPLVLQVSDTRVLDFLPRERF